jgi:nucleoside-diphosphate-sugar epimerase
MVPGKTWEPAITNYGLRQITRSLRLDITGAKKYLNWTPRLTFEDGLEELE